MQFKAEYNIKLVRDKQYNQPRLCGWKDCHEFSISSDPVCDWELVHKDHTVEVPLVANSLTYQMSDPKTAKPSLYGPASKMDRKIIYPCNIFHCRIECSCRLCQKKTNYCEKAKDTQTCDSDCGDCKDDYNEHLLLHFTVQTT